MATDTLDAFTRSYIAAMLWSTTDESDDAGGQPLDKHYDAGDLAPETLTRVIADCKAFQTEMCDTLGACLDQDGGFYEQAGH